MYSVDDLFYWAKIKMVILNFWGMLWQLVTVVQIRHAPISLHTLIFPVRLMTSLVGHCLSIPQPHRGEAEEQVANFMNGCRVCPALFKVGRCSHSVMPCAKAAGPGHPIWKRWWQVCSVGLWSCLCLALLPSDRCFWAWYEVLAHLFLSTVALPIFFSLVVVCAWSQCSSPPELGYDKSYSQ